jgi:hypothetical protein
MEKLALLKCRRESTSMSMDTLEQALLTMNKKAAMMEAGLLI